ncbi:MAG: GGDEF domain-containing protein [Pseudolabrys sp.]
MPQAGRETPKAEEGADALAALRAKIARLKADLDTARRRIADLEAREDVDPLLDILNRRGFERELKRALAYIERYGTEAVLIYIDLDGFKKVNDRHGHAAGDDLLKTVAKAIVSHVRASDTVARLGGDEFAALIWNAGTAPAAAKARELESLITATSIFHGETLLSVGASAGIAPLRPEASVADVIDAADRAMYARKKERRRA